MKREPIGYEWIVQELGIKAIPHWRATYFTERSTRRSQVADGRTIEEYPFDYFTFPKTILGHLEFAVRHEGINLAIIKEITARVEAEAIAALVQEKPFAASRRRIWFLWEYFREELVHVSDLTMGNYLPLFDEKQYLAPYGTLSSRHRVRANLLGDKRFCAVIRRTLELEKFIGMSLDQEARRLVSQHDATTIHRAIAYLYAKETKSSYAIERESPSPDRMERFVGVLRRLDRKTELTKTQLVALQNMIVSEPRFADADYRSLQNYVSVTNHKFQELVHFVPPKPNDVPELMDGLFEALRIGLESPTLDPVVLAAAIAFGFVFVHPFDDGNGRLHRYLIHYVLARREFTPPAVIVPVSAPMHADPHAYDTCLESFSRPLMEQVRFKLDDEARMEVEGETADLYRFVDYTRMAEYLFACVEKAIREDFAQELKFLVGFDAAKTAIESRVDLPDRLVTLFIRVCAQNGWKLSKKKRDQFAVLTDEEIAKLEDAVREAFSEDGPQE